MMQVVEHQRRNQLDFEEIIEKITPAMKRASRKAPTNVEDLDAGKAKTPKRKTSVLDSPSANGFDEHEDGKYPRNRPMASELLTLAELSLLSDEHGRPANKNKSIPEKRAAVGAPGPRKAPMNKVHGRSNKRRASS
ncbi:MAG: hypothetical protein Q9188_005906 [Gyalolechia gomerana]